MWRSLIQILEGFNRANTDFAEQDRILPAGSLQIRIVTLAFPRVSSLQVYPTDFGLAMFHNYINQFHKIRTFLCLYRYTCRYKDIHIHGLWLVMFNTIYIYVRVCVLSSFMYMRKPNHLHIHAHVWKWTDRICLRELLLKAINYDLVKILTMTWTNQHLK